MCFFLSVIYSLTVACNTKANSKKKNEEIIKQKELLRQNQNQTITLFKVFI